MDSQTDVHSLLKDAQKQLVALEARVAELENNSKELDSKLASLGYDPAVHKFDDISIDPLNKYIKSDSTNKPKHILPIEPVESAIGKKPKVVDPSLFPEIGRVVAEVDKNKDDDNENEEDDEDGDNKEEIEGVTVINNTMCMRCGGNGQTRMLMVKIPFFREIILMSFECDDCGEKNNEVQSGAAVQPKGCSYNLKLLNIDDFSRQIVKSEHATVRFEELDFEIPAEKGEMTNIEGLLRSAFDALSDSQPRRREIDEEAAKKVDEFLSKLEDALDGESFPMTMTLHDPSGNSFVENKLAPKTDPQLKIEYFKRSLEEHLKLGFQPEHYESENLVDKNIEFSASSAATLPPRHIKTGGKLEKEALTTRSIVEKEVYMFPSPCPNCGDINQNAKMYVTDIPFFKEIVIMAFNCEECEYKSNEIKGAGSIPKFGQKITLKVRSMATNAKGFKEDMARDVIKSNSAGIIIPEIDVEVTQGSLGGMYTTVEGLLNTIKDSLFDGMADDLISGDSADSERKSKFRKLEDKFNNYIAGYESFTLILVDPLANSYVYNPYSPEADPMLTIQDYERTEEENDDLGLTQMKVDDYVDNPSDEEEVENTQVELNLNPDIIASVKNLQKDGAAAHPYANYTHSVEDKVEKQ